MGEPVHGRASRVVLEQFVIEYNKNKACKHVQRSSDSTIRNPANTYMTVMLNDPTNLDLISAVDKKKISRGKLH